MKKFLICSMMLLATAAFVSCEKDDANVDPAPDPCEGITCENGGECVNGACDCPEGFSDPSCGTQVTPSVLRIDSVRFTHLKAYPSDSTNWDNDSGPDIYFEIFDLQGHHVFTSDEILDNAAPYATYTYTENMPIELTGEDIHGTYIVRWIDDDAGSPEVMGTGKMAFYESENGFPDKLEYEGEWAHVFYLSYIFP